MEQARVVTHSKLERDIALLEALQLPRSTGPMSGTGPGACIVLTTSGSDVPAPNAFNWWCWKCSVKVDVQIPAEEALAFLAEVERLIAVVKTRMAQQKAVLAKYGIAKV
jgi:hypothetical protein